MYRRLRTIIRFSITTALMAAVLTACSPGDPFRSTGSYPIDVFQEMHYNQSHKAQEPPRFLPPEGAYPTEGGFLPIASRAAAIDLINPLTGDGDTMKLGALVYKQNCASCHGDLADGRGPVGDILNQYTGVQPPAFDSSRILGLTAGEKFASIAIGYGRMPAFQGLLSETDRWALISLIEATASERNAELSAITAIPEQTRTLELLRLRSKF